jgi:hypothetical protein
MCLDDLLQNESSEFPQLLLNQLKLETNRCTDVQRLFAAENVALGLLHSNQTGLVSV